MVPVEALTFSAAEGEPNMPDQPHTESPDRPHPECPDREELAAFAVGNRAFSYFVTLVVAIAGVASFFTLGQLEDPEFAVKSAVVSLRYPGASPEEVELEVADRIEIALQELPQLDYVESWSRPGKRWWPFRSKMNTGPIACRRSGTSCGGRSTTCGRRFRQV